MKPLARLASLRHSGKHGLGIFVVVLALVGLALASAALFDGALFPSGETALAGEARRFGIGQGSTPNTTALVDQLKTDPASFVGRKVDTQGTVVDFTGQRGLWLASADGQVIVFVALSDSVRELPSDVRKGSVVHVKGTVRKADLGELRTWNPAMNERTQAALGKEQIYVLADDLMGPPQGSGQGG